MFGIFNQLYNLWLISWESSNWLISSSFQHFEEGLEDLSTVMSNRMSVISTTGPTGRRKHDEQDLRILHK